jgi:uncharacterized membrane protein
MQWYIIFVGIIHTIFGFCEMYPWSNPILLKKASANLKSEDNTGEKDLKFTGDRQELVATIVHNTGIYNIILAFCLFWAAFRGNSVSEASFALLVGVSIAGLFGTATLKSSVTAFQAVIGIIGAVLIGRSLYF